MAARRACGLTHVFNICGCGYEFETEVFYPSPSGFGAGAGNTQLEVLIAVLHKLGYETGIDLYGVLDLGDLTERELMDEVPTISSTSVVSGLAGVFSGFLKPVKRIAAMDTFVAYQPILEDVILPQPEDIYRGIVDLKQF